MSRFLAFDWDHNQLHIVAATSRRGGVRIDKSVVWQEPQVPNPAEAEALGRLLRERFGAIPGVRSTMSTIALETLKEHWSLPVEPLPVPEKERLRA